MQYLYLPYSLLEVTTSIAISLIKLFKYKIKTNSNTKKLKNVKFGSEKGIRTA